jgi:hypothetical protein
MSSSPFRNSNATKVYPKRGILNKNISDNQLIINFVKSGGSSPFSRTKTIKLLIIH